MEFSFEKGATLNRRRMLQQLGAAPLLLRAARFAEDRPGSEQQTPYPLQVSGTRYRPDYPVRSPLEDVLNLVEPGHDEFALEKPAAELDAVLGLWSAAMTSGKIKDLTGLCLADIRWSPLMPASSKQTRSAFGIEGSMHHFAAVSENGAPAFISALTTWFGKNTRVIDARFEITTIQQPSALQSTVVTEVRFNFVLEGSGRREQRNGMWRLTWQSEGAANWRMNRFEALTEARGILTGPGFVDVTQQALGDTESYRQQMTRGSDFWRTELDGASGIDVYGNNGVAVGDFDNNGLDDLYVSQPAGLPNRLYRNRGDGTFEDVTDRTGVGVLDNTACALFADLRNSGLQDLVVVCGSGPLLFLNQGDGTFTLKRGAFQFATPPQGAFTSAAIADYDGDGRLDIYFCLYSYYLGLEQYHYPAPYFDARNGPPNFLMHNQGDGTFTDRTTAAGLDAENSRYSFACAWSHSPGRKTPDLYVVNDFGRNNLYRGQDDGTFRAVSSAAHVEDVGAGMSACWRDTTNDGRPDLYVSNMWSAAGQRVSRQAAFHPQSTPDARALYQRHAHGNALYRNKGDGQFENVTEAAGVEPGRWAWGADFWDFDHDGFADLYVTNGYITPPRDLTDSPRKPADLASFFWRQVVAKSPDDLTPAVAYEHGWNALNELIRADAAWSGSERNVFFANNGDGTFTDVSGALGLDFIEDGRSFALADLDGDGRLEVIVKSRNGPQLRILHNDMEALGDSIAFRLRGSGLGSNRDAIGATLIVTAGRLVQTRSLEAGSGFLSQHTKELFFGLGKTEDAIAVTIHWRSGLSQTFTGLPRNTRIEIEEGKAAFAAKPFRANAKAYAAVKSAPVRAESIPTSVSTWLLDPLTAPPFTLPDATGKQVKLVAVPGRTTLLTLVSGAQSGSIRHLDVLDRGYATLLARKIDVIALNVDPSAGQASGNRRSAIPVLAATVEMAGIYNIVFRYLYDRHANLPLPTSFLLDDHGMIVKVYQGELAVNDVMADARSIPLTRQQRVARALPFPGTLHQGTFERNDFTYGIAMFQHGYLEQAATSFEEVLKAHPNDAEALYNLGTLNLRRSHLALAREQLERTVALKPNYPEAWNNLGMMAAQQGQTADAIRHFEQSLALRPAYTTALLNLGNLYRHEHSFAEAETYLSRALTLAPNDPEANYSFGMLNAQQGHVPTAETRLERAIELRPAYAEARNNLGVLYLQQQRTVEAEQQFLASIRLAPAFQNAYFNLAKLYLVQQDKARARATLNELLKLQPANLAAQQALAALEQTP